MRHAFTFLVLTLALAAGCSDERGQRSGSASGGKASLPRLNGDEGAVPAGQGRSDRAETTLPESGTNGPPVPSSASPDIESARGEEQAQAEDAGRE